MRELPASSGFTPVASSPDDFRSFVDAEIKRYAPLVREAKISVGMTRTDRHLVPPQRWVRQLLPWPCSAHSVEHNSECMQGRAR
jgi:hypothetical protein